MNERVRAAVVGLAKAGPAADLTPEELPYVSREGDTPETRFLLAAAAADLWEQAGREAAPAPAVPEPCDDRAVPPAPPELAAVVAAVCEEHPVLLREVCERLVDRGLSLPPRTLPAAFGVASSGAGARGGRTTAIRAAVAAAAGPRGRWLAGFNPDWAWVSEQAAGPTPASEGKAPADLAEAFAADHFGTRLNALRRWRAADPAAARAALEETWKGETAFRRAALLETFETGLSAADEPFLEAALADRSKALPAVAENLLLGLPDSAFAAARRAAADALLDVAGRLKAKLVVTLPPASGQQIEGDAGIDWGLLATEPAKGAAGGRGVRAERLVRALASVPPSHWLDRFGREPADLIALAEPAEHGEDVLAGWTAAAARFATTDATVAAGWAPALSEWACAQLNRARRGKKAAAAVPAAGESLTEFIAALPPAAAADFVRPLLTAKAVAKAPEELGALLWNAVPDPWPDDFARAVVAAIEAGDGKRGYDYWKWQEPIGRVLERLPPAVLADLPPGWPAPHDLPNWLERASAAALLRRRLHELLP
ncbi:DUF5691 domain-containing protein [Alienimonas californiensis]|uniref:Uncharacterized protein n=1 Tax=Alienimonas californiensis TaxID=2527989 RepID=A0A517P665_9PLAN|nr:DUF5691 domain-containing protein [Alienimonas californiensis]QDT14863.1 hypothetical protein CA12_09430 [Alienimonas californiensis]